MELNDVESPVPDIMELEELSLFQEDPYHQEMSQLELKEQTRKQDMHLLEGEALLHKFTFKTTVQGDTSHIRGIFATRISNYRVILVDQNMQTSLNEEQWSEHLNTPISIPFAMMSDIDLVKKQIMIKLKTGLNFKIKPESNQTQTVYQLLLKGYMAIPFFSRHIFQREESLTYDCLAEMQRIRMNWNYLIIVKNSNGELCPTYPKYFIVPKKVEQNLLEECLKIRNQCRIPVATYYWTEHKAALWRAAKVKANQDTNKFNLAYIKQISRQPIFIEVNEQLVSSPQKSIKSSFSYKFMSNQGLNSMLQKILVSYAKDESILKYLERWNQDVHTLIKCAYLAVNELRIGKQVILEENNGLDRVCQISALAQLIVEPYYRTINGFSILIEKQFVSFGHPFNFRLGFQRQKLMQQSPIFIQFLQCVSQLIATHPKCFEFSSFYLARIAYEVFSAKYNNFYFNDEELKKKYEYVLRTSNIWKHLPMKKQFFNYQWEQKEAVKALINLRPPSSVKQFLVWKQFYDMVTELRCQQPDQIHVKKRKSSLYKMLHKNSFKNQ